MTLTLSPPEATSRTKERDTLKTNVWVRGRMGLGWANETLGSLCFHPPPFSCHTALPQADTVQAATPWGKHGGFGISQPLETKIPILCPDTHRCHAAYTSRKAMLWAELLHATVQSHPQKILNTCEKMEVVLFYSKLLQCREIELCSPPISFWFLPQSPFSIFSELPGGQCWLGGHFPQQISLEKLHKSTELVGLHCQGSEVAQLEVPRTADSHTEAEGSDSLECDRGSLSTRRGGFFIFIYRYRKKRID